MGGSHHIIWQWAPATHVSNMQRCITQHWMGRRRRRRGTTLKRWRKCPFRPHCHQLTSLSVPSNAHGTDQPSYSTPRYSPTICWHCSPEFIGSDDYGKTAGTFSLATFSTSAALHCNPLQYSVHHHWPGHLCTVLTAIYTDFTRKNPVLDRATIRRAVWIDVTRKVLIFPVKLQGNGERVPVLTHLYTPAIHNMLGMEIVCGLGVKLRK